jgi:thiamine pyrophosphokinase
MTNAAQTRALIFTGGRLGDWAPPLIRPGDFLIGADRGALFLIERGFAPHLAVGDFDSIRPDQLAAVREAALECKTFDAVDKDWTDTELALREAIARGCRNVVIVGGLGTRFDHSLANVHLLRLAADASVSAALADEHNEIRLLSGPNVCRVEADPRYPNISLLPLTPEASGITLSGFAYPLRKATLRIGMSLGISNRLAEPEGTIALGEGQLLVIRSRD